MNRRYLIRRILVLALGAAVCLSSQDAWAQNKKDPDKAVAKWDKDGDGFLTRDDFAKFWAGKAGKKKAGGSPQGAASGKDRVDKASALMKASSEARKNGKGTEALTLIREAAALIEGATANKKMRQKILSNLAQREYGTGNTKAALKALQKAAKVRPSLQITSDIVPIYIELGRLKAAEKTAGKARKMAEKVLARDNVSEKKRNIFGHDLAMIEADLLEKQGRWQDAESKIRDAVAFAGKLKDKKKWATQGVKDIQRLARNLKRQGRLVEAEISGREALNEARSTREKADAFVGNLTRFVGETLLAQGRKQEAQKLAEQAIEIFAAAGEQPSSRKSVLARRFLGTILILQGDWKGAAKEFARVREDLADNKGLRTKLIDKVALVVLSDIKEGKAKDVLEKLETQHKNLLRRLGNKHAYTALKRALIGVAHAAIDDQKTALEDFSDSVPYLLSRSRESDSDEDESQSSAAVIRRQVLESYLGLLADLKSSGTRIPVDPVAETFRIAESARGSVVQKALAASGARAVAGNEELANLVRAEQDGRKSIGALNAFLAQRLNALEEEQDAEAIAEIRAEIDQARSNRAGAMEEIERRFPDYAQLINPKPPTIDEARAALAPGEALITTYFGDTRGFAWAISKDAGTAFTEIEMTAEDLDDMVAILRSALDPGAASVADIPDFDVESAYDLYAEILKPLESAWKGAKSLILVAHGPLGSLPISVLPTTNDPLPPPGPLPFANHGQVAWLAKTHSVTLVPSVSAMVALRALPPAKRGRAPFIGFGDPYFSKKQAKIQVAQAGGGVALRGAPLKLRSALRGGGIDSRQLASLPRLPDTASEVTSIALALGTDPAQVVFLGEAADEKRVKSMDLSRYRVLTFATHGLVANDLEGLTQPALALTTPVITGNDEDGLLTMEEILGLELDADWVVLSACNTASAGRAGAEAVSGLGQAFFYAGTRALLASNWPVETTSAKALTTDIFRRQAEDPGLARAEALRRATMALMETGALRDPGTGRALYSFAHPLFWAPFSLIGDGR